MAEVQRQEKMNGTVIVVGPSGVGKTCLVQRLVHDEYSCQKLSVGIQVERKSVFIDNIEVNLFLYDTAGIERYAEMQKSYYRQGQVGLLCFDLSDLSTFDNALFWYRKAHEAKSDIGFVLVGCKEDMIADAQVDVTHH